jgi:hypothetical protein
VRIWEIPLQETIELGQWKCFGHFFWTGNTKGLTMAWQARTKGKSPKGRPPQTWGRRETEQSEGKVNWKKANDCSTPWEKENSFVNPIRSPVEEAGLCKIKKLNNLKLAFWTKKISGQEFITRLSETSINIYQTTRCHITQDCKLHNHSHDTLRGLNFASFFLHMPVASLYTPVLPIDST